MKRITKLQEIERQVEEEGKQWKRKRTEELIKQLAEDSGEFSPPAPAAPDEEAVHNSEDHDAQRGDRDRDGIGH
ncbi:MAG: hypothetical protein BWY63_03694 [Chloroflexi bacterium ADurb.Bin360]|nr:MAG: hypothetical protein BWY63_03694 [Chloroflexi bacterium ADurb.Bin360]